ncbi:hypothetical protein ACFWHR_03570 [Leucobacter sp. NPDC058333]|uniref:hypothetical protein n=1 Tax=Leucobacter sp. NPDC058333 TaxID=3346450 RepID=UPI00364AF0D1
MTLNSLTPAPTPTPRNRRARIAKLIIAGVTVLCLGVAGLAAYVNWPDPYPVGAAASLPAGERDPLWADRNTTVETSSHEKIWHDMNTALQTQDRELFLSYADGDAKGQLALWWDNLSAIGWTTGYVSPNTDADGSQVVTIGVDLAFPANQMRGSGAIDAGLILTQGFTYKITTAGSDDDLRITSFVPGDVIMPWDDGKLYVERRDHVVLFALEDERALVTEHIDEAERSAVETIDLATKMGGEIPQTGFASGITGSDERFERWRFGTEVPTEGKVDASAFARPSFRPYQASEIIDPKLAVGSETGGTTVIMGPGAAYDFRLVFIHEFAHAIHFTAAPELSWSYSKASMEGFARYAEYASGASEFVAYPELKNAVATLGAGAFADERFTMEPDVHFAYDSAGSCYLFVAENGGDPWALAVDAVTQGRDITDLAAETSPTLSVANWQQWVAGR